MGLTSITNRVTYAGDGSSTVFPFPYYFFNNQDLQVYLFDTGSSIIYPQSLNTNYTISGNASTAGTYPSGANVVLASSATSSMQVIITRRPSEVQQFVLTQNGQINAAALVQQFDYTTALIQALDERVSRAIVLPDGLGYINGSSFGTQLPNNLLQASSAFQFLAVNSGATGFQLMQIPGFGSSVLAVSQGGTGQSNPLVAGQLIYSVGQTNMGGVPGAASGFVLVSQGSSAPTWQQLPLAGSSFVGQLPIANGGTGQAAKAPAFNALSPNSTQGDFSWFQGSSNVNLPIGGTNQVLTVGVNSSVTWANPSSNLSVSTKTANYVAVSADDLILTSSSGFTISLPNAVGNSGKQIRVLKTDAPLASVTIQGTSAQTIGGFGFVTVATQNESWVFGSDNANWQIVDHSIPSNWVNYTPNFTNFGSVTNSVGFYKRVNDSIFLAANLTDGTPTVGSCAMSLPGTLITDSSKLSPLAVNAYLVGKAVTDKGTTTWFGDLSVLARGNLSNVTFGKPSSGTGPISELGGTLIHSGFLNVNLAIQAGPIPIVSWFG